MYLPRFIFSPVYTIYLLERYIRRSYVLEGIMMRRKKFITFAHKKKQYSLSFLLLNIDLDWFYRFIAALFANLILPCQR